MKQKKKSIVFLISVLMCVSAILLIPQVSADVTVESGDNPDAILKAAVRYKSFDNGGDREVYLGIPDLGVGSNRVETDYTWGSSHYINFDYRMRDGTDNLYTTVDGNDPLLTYDVGALTDLDYIQIDVVSRNSGTVSFQNVFLTYETGGESLGTFTSNTEGSKSWMITGVDVTNGFIIEGTIVITGTQPHGELSKVEIKVGTLPSCSPEVWVDDDYTSISCGGHTWGYDAFDCLQDGIDNVCDVDGTVNVYDGTYGVTGLTNKDGYNTAILIKDKEGLTVKAILGNEPVVKPLTSVEANIISMSIEDCNNVIIDNIDSDQTIAQWDNWHVFDTDDLTVKNSQFEGGEDGIDFNTALATALIENNIFKDITTGSGDEVLDFTDAACTDVVIQDNFFDYNYRQITLDNGDSNFIIRRNIMDGTNSQEAIRFIDASDIIVENNVIMNSMQQGIYIDSGCSDITIWHNSLFNNDQENGPNGEIRTKVLTADIVIQNNILFGNGFNPSIETSSASLPGENYNCIYNTVDTGFTFSANTLVGQDPKFISTVVGSEDLHLQSTSPCVDTGLNVGVTEDIEGNVRDANPDMGAYECECTCTPICRNVEDNIEYCTIQAAIDAATTDDGETIEVYAGTFQENAETWCDIDLYKDVSIIGQGSGSTIIELTEGKSEGLQIMGGNPTDISIEGITFTHASTSTNAAKRAIRVFSDLNSLTLRDVAVEYAEVNNLEINGDIGSFTIEDSSFTFAGANGLMCPGDINMGSITDSHFDYNGRLDVWASGMHLFGLTSDLDIISCTMSHNTDSGFNGRQLTTIYFEDVTASYNTHSGGGGGICISEKVGTSSDITLVDVTAEYNGRDGVLVWTWYDYCTIYDVTIYDGVFTNNGWAGIRVLNWPTSGSVGGSVFDIDIYQNEIMNNPGSGVGFDLGYGASDATSSHVFCNYIVGNANYGVYNAGTGVLDAECNWWGDCSGPSGEGSGTGDAVSTNVDFDPWVGMVVADTGGPYEECDYTVDFYGGDSSVLCLCGFDSILSYDWDFGDGTFYTGVNPSPSHTYSTWGSYDIELTVTTSLGCTATDTSTVNICGATAEANGDYEASYSDNYKVVFSSVGSDGYEMPLSYHWDFGDGESSTDANPTHEYGSCSYFNPTVTVTLTVTTNNGCSDIDTAIVNLQGDDDCSPPIVDILNPDDGDVVGGAVSVEWYAVDGGYPGDRLPMYLYYRPLDVGSVHLIAGPVENTGEYTWNVGGLADGEYLLIVEAAGSCGIGHDSVEVRVGGGGAGLRVDVSVVDTSVESSVFVKDGDMVMVTAAVTGNGASVLTVDEITADLSGFGYGDCVVAESYNGFEASWTVSNVMCAPSDGVVVVTVSAGDEVSGSGRITADNTDPIVSLDKPLFGLYFFNGRLIPLKDRTIIIGPVDVKVDVIDVNGVDRVVFSVDDVVVKTVSDDSFEWYMNLKLTGTHKLDVMVYDHAGNSVQVSQMVTVFNFFGN